MPTACQVAAFFGQQYLWKEIIFIFGAQIYIQERKNTGLPFSLGVVSYAEACLNSSQSPQENPKFVWLV